MANDILVKIGADITDFSRKMAESNKALSNFGKANAETFDAFKKTGAAVTGAGVALAGGLGFAVKTAANFESAMSSVAAISGATGEDFELLSAKAREMGASTSFSASEAAEGLEYMALAGWNTQQMLGGIEPILHLAEAGALDLGRASDLVTDSMSALGLEVSDLDGYLDKVAKTAASANTDIDALMEAFVIAGGTFERFNVPLAEANAFLGVMANRGFKGSEAGTALNAIMTRLTASTGPSAKALKELGVNAYDSSGNFRGMEAVMKDVEKKLSGLTDKERAHYQTQIAGLNHGKAFSAMLSGLGNEYDDLKGAIIDSDGALIDMRNTMKNNLQGALENLSSAFEEIQIALGSALLPAIKVIISFLQFLADKFNALPNSVKSFIAIGAALSAVLLIVGGGLLLIVGFIPQIIAGFAALKTVALAVAGALGSISAPIWVVIAVIGALVAALVYAWRQSESFREGVTAVFNRVKEVISNALSAVVGFIQEKLAFITEFWAENGAQLVEATQNIWNFIQSIIEVVMPIITAILQGAWFVIQTIVMAVWENIKGVIDGALNIILGLVKIFGSLFTGDWQGVWEGVKQVFKGAIQVLWNAVQLMLWGRLLKGVMTFARAFGSNIASLWSSVSSIFTRSINAIRNFFTAGFNALRTVSSTTMSGIRSVVTSAFNAVRSVVSSVISAVVNTVRSGFTNVVSAIRSSMSSALSAVRSILTSMAGVVRGGVSKFASAGRDLIKGLINGIKNMTSAAIGAITGVVDGVVNKAKSLLKISSPSRVFEQIGAWTGEGLVDGMLSMVKEVDKASDKLAESAIPDVKNIDMSYATPDGITARSLAGAVRGTVDVNSRDDRLINAIGALERRLTNLEVVMDGRTVGRIVEPYVTENQERNDYVKKLTK